MERAAPRRRRAGEEYAGKLALRFAYATNGQGIYSVDMQTGAETEVSRYATPDEIWARTVAEENTWRNRCTRRARTTADA